MPLLLLVYTRVMESAGKCRACEAEVSHRARACPHCGCEKLGELAPLAVVADLALEPGASVSLTPSANETLLGYVYEGTGDMVIGSQQLFVTGRGESLRNFTLQFTESESPPPLKTSIDKGTCTC